MERQGIEADLVCQGAALHALGWRLEAQQDLVSRPARAIELIEEY